MTLESRPGQVSFLIQATRYSVTLDQETDAQGIVASTGQPWIRQYAAATTTDPLSRAQEVGGGEQKEPMMHVECTFLNRHALRVRMGLHSSFPFPDPFPVDPDFPPPVLRPSMFPPGQTTEPIAGEQRDDLVCGLDLHADEGSMWVNPPDSGWVLKWQAAPFGLRASHCQYHHHRDQEEDQGKDSFEQAPLGPFTPVLLPSGILNIEDVLAGTEPLILDVGEKIQSGGLGLHPPPPSQQQQQQQIGEPVVPVPPESRESFSQHFGGTYHDEPTTASPPPFLWSDRGWGILMKDPLAVRMAGLVDGRAVLSLMMAAGGRAERAGEGGMIDYVVVVGEALEACREEYPVR